MFRPVMPFSASSVLATDGWRTPRRRWSWAPGGLWYPEAAAAPPPGEGRRLEFYVLWSLREPPRQFSSKCRQKCYQTRLPLPLPKWLVVFGLGDWSRYSRNTSITVEILINSNLQPQKIGVLGPEARCLVWEGDWRVDILTASLKQAKSGAPIKILLTVTEQLLNSTPTHPCQAAELNQSPVFPEDAVQQLEAGPSEPTNQGSAVPAKGLATDRKEFSPPVEMLLMLPAPKTPGEEDRKKNSTSKQMQLKCRRILFELLAPESQPESEDLEVKQLQECPSPRWCHAMCLSDPDTAVLFGGEGSNQHLCKDALWKLEIDNDFWFPVGFPAQDSTVQCSRGHSATYDPDSKRIYIFGGLKQRKHYSSIYILDTAFWKWLQISPKGDVPALAYHSATIYHRELFVFGGAFTKKSSLEPGACSNSIYIFNPEYEIWYQPIVEGEKPLPRLGHSATLLGDKLIIFGGQRASVYLNDTHILDLGFMEYTSVSYLSGQPPARSFHAAIPISDHHVLISGGCNAKGAFQDAFTFHLDTLTWSTIKHGDLCSVPRAGHTLLNLTYAHQKDSDKEKWSKHNLCTVLIFGGSNCAGKFYNSTNKFQLDLEEVIKTSQNLA